MARAARLVLLALATAAGCRLDKEPLRAGWLASGVYEQPPVPLCSPPRPPGRPYDELDRWTPPSLRGSAEVRLSLPWAGSFSAELHEAGSRGARATVSSKATAPVRIVEDRGVAQQIPGFVAGVDLRPYRRIAFIADTSGYMCDYPACPDGGWGRNIPAPLLQVMGDQIDAAVSGLRPDQWFAVYAGAARRGLRFLPASAQGRGLAGQFVRGQVCSGIRGVRRQVLDALADSADAIVLFTDGHPQRREHDRYERDYENCQVAPSILFCYVDDATEAVDLQRLADGRPLPPVITVSLTRHDATWLRNLAEATGGVHVDLAP